MTFGSSYQEVRKNEGSRNLDSCICHVYSFVKRLIVFCFALPFSKVRNALTIYSKFVSYCERQFPPKLAWVDSA